MFFNRKKDRFSTIFDRHYKRLLNYALKVTRDRELSEGLVQETFVKLWEGFEEINKEDRSVEAFLITALKNKIIDSYRRQEVKDRHHQLIGARLESSTLPEEYWDLIKQIEQIQNALEPRTREIFRLSREETLAYREIAEQLNVSHSAVMTQLFRARKQLKTKLEKNSQIGNQA